MTSSPITRSLERHFSKNRIVFWYDEAEEWKGEVAGLDLEQVELVRVESNEIGVKFRVLVDAPEQKFLIYVPAARPSDEQNWLLDILLSHEEFHADRASLQLQETGLPPEYKELPVQHARFFSKKQNRESLRDQLEKSETHRTVRRRMMAILVNAQDHSLDAILLELCEKLAKEELLDPVLDSFEESQLVEPFWKEVEMQYGYHDKTPSLFDFLLCLFQHNAPLSKNEETMALQSQAVVFLSRWKDSKSARACYETLSFKVANALNVKEDLNSLDDKGIELLITQEVDAYETIERRIISWFRDGILSQKWTPEARRTIIEKRARTVWFTKYETLYEALNHSAELFDFIARVDLTADSIKQGVEKYQSTWWKVDFHYRKFHAQRRASSHGDLLGLVEATVEKQYLTEYLSPLATLWERLLDVEKGWVPSGIPRLRDFFPEVVKPQLTPQKKLVVIISDGFRYECGVEFREKLLKETSKSKSSGKDHALYSAELSARVASLPAYTQLGMASHLPHENLSLSDDAKVVLADGHPTLGSANREKILNLSGAEKIKVLTAEEFMELHVKNEARPMMTEHDALFIYHNEIDKAGSSLTTEKSVTTACESALNTLIKLVKRATNVNVSNIVVTADHGFLFRQSEIQDIECLAAPKEGLIANPNRRYVIGKGLESDHSLRVYEAGDLGLKNDLQVGIVKGVQRLKVKGSGKRFVHEGSMPQEVIVPVLSINKARTGDNEIKRVEVEIQSFPQKVTTMHLSIRLFQKDIVSEEDKVLGRELEVAIYAPNGKQVSDVKMIRFELTDPEPRSREMKIDLTLGHEVNDYNNQELEIRLCERISSNHAPVYASVKTNLAISYEQEYDDFS